MTLTEILELTGKLDDATGEDTARERFRRHLKKAMGAPTKKRHKKVRHTEKYPYVLELKGAKLYLDNPVVIDQGLWAKLKAFEGRDPQTSWAWLVQGTRALSEGDFGLLTRGDG